MNCTVRIVQVLLTLNCKQNIATLLQLTYSIALPTYSGSNPLPGVLNVVLNMIVYKNEYKNELIFHFLSLLVAEESAKLQKTADENNQVIKTVKEFETLIVTEDL